MNYTHAFSLKGPWAFLDCHKIENNALTLLVTYDINIFVPMNMISSTYFYWICQKQAKLIEEMEIVKTYLA